MKKKFLAVFSIVFVMAFAVAVFAFNQSSNKTAVASCPMSDNCPLKGKNAQTASVKTDGSCCDNPDCCCKNGSCPMKAKGANHSESGDCCDDCCGGSCPMNEKQTAQTTDKTLRLKQPEFNNFQIFQFKRRRMLNLRRPLLFK